MPEREHKIHWVWMGVVSATLLQVIGQTNEPSALDLSTEWEEAKKNGMFVLSAGDSAFASIVTTKSDPQALKVATQLQEIIHRIGGVRLPIEDQLSHTEEWYTI